MNHELVILGFAAVASTLVTAAVAKKSNTRFSDKSWDELINEIEPVNVRLIEALALDHLNPSTDQIEIEPFEMWMMIGGVEGLVKMQHNAEIICALAAYAVRWNFDEAVIVTERIRREALTIRRAIAKATRYGFVEPVKRVHAPFHLYEVAVAYHLMRTRVLTLYQASHAGLYPQLAASL